MIVSGQCDDSDKCFCQCNQHLNHDMDAPIPPGFLWSLFMDPPQLRAQSVPHPGSTGYDIYLHCCLC